MHPSRSLGEVDAWAEGNPAEVAAEFSPRWAFPRRSSRWRSAGRPTAMQPIDEAVAAEQQKIADTFLELGPDPEGDPDRRGRRGGRSRERISTSRRPLVPADAWRRPLSRHARRRRAVDLDYLRQIAQAADALGYFGVLFADRASSCDYSRVSRRPLPPLAERLQFLVAVSFCLDTPTITARLRPGRPREAIRRRHAGGDRSVAAADRLSSRPGSWQPAGLAVVARAAGAQRHGAGALGQLRSGALPHHVWVSTERALVGLAIGGGLGFALGLLNGVFPFAERLLDSSLQMLRNIPASGGDPAGHPLVRDRRAGQAVPGRRRRAVSDLPQHLPRHPPRRPRPGRDGAFLWARPLGAVQPGHPARRLAVHPGRPALRARHHVADPDRRRDDLGLGGDRLHDHERPRVPADRRRPAGHPRLRAARQARRLADPGTRAAVPRLASRLPERESGRHDRGPRVLDAAAELQRRRSRPQPSRGLAVQLERGREALRRAAWSCAGIDLDIRAGSFVAIVGRSGGGKSTLLRLLAGLEKQTTGRMFSSMVSLSLACRPACACCSRTHACCPGNACSTMSALPAARTGANAHRRCSPMSAWATAATIGPLCCRAANASAWPWLAPWSASPRLLLLDEPFGALDALTRMEMHDLLGRIWIRERFTTVLITHDVVEAVMLADRVLVLKGGRMALDVRSMPGGRVLRRSPAARPRAQGVGRRLTSVRSRTRENRL